MKNEKKMYAYCQQCKTSTYHIKLNIYNHRLEDTDLDLANTHVFKHNIFYSHECIVCGVKAKIDVFES